MVTNSLEHVEIVGSREVAKLMQEKLKLYLHVIAATGSFGKPGITNQGFYFHVIQFANDFPTNDSNDWLMRFGASLPVYWGNERPQAALARLEWMPLQRGKGQRDDILANMSQSWAELVRGSASVGITTKHVPFWVVTYREKACGKKHLNCLVFHRGRAETGKRAKRENKWRRELYLA